jgi:hypothetical protein
LKVDLDLEVTEVNSEWGYVLFVYTDSESGKRKNRGSFTLIRADDEVTVTLQLPDLPSYHEQHLLQKLRRKLEEEHGEAPRPPKKPPQKDKDEGDGKDGEDGKGKGGDEIARRVDVSSGEYARKVYEHAVAHVQAALGAHFSSCLTTAEAEVRRHINSKESARKAIELLPPPSDEILRLLLIDGKTERQVALLRDSFSPRARKA